MRLLLILFTLLTIWGPPRLRLVQRPLETALNDPWNLDVAALFQVLVWAGAAVVIAIILGGRLLAGKPLFPLLTFRSSLKWYFLYFLMALVSAFYSVRPIYTILAAAKIFLSILSVVLLTDEASLRATRPLILDLFYAVNICQWVANMVFFVADPELVGTEIPNIGYRLHGGIFGDYGAAAACSGLFFLAQAMSYTTRLVRWINWALYLLTWVFVAYSRTRSTLVGALVMFVSMILLYRRPTARILASVATLLALGIFLAAGGLDPLIEFAMRGQKVSSLLTLTGRSQAFDYLFEAWKGAPWLGYGFGAGSRYLLVLFVNRTGMGIGSAHDALSRVLVDLGMAGTVLLLAIVVIIWKEMLRLIQESRKDPSAHALAVQLFALVSLYSLVSVVSSGIAEAPYPFLIAAVGAAVVRRQVLQQRRKATARQSDRELSLARGV